uniref:CTCK domain-containing protein n=1 Tax=Homalodisca liturata TaxID=320908 RepID=A0A1B6IUV8_9HEMI
MCDISGKQVQVISSQEQCPSLLDCPVENQYQDGCCLKCNQTTAESHNLCTPVALAINETVRLVRTELPSHGVCENYESIPNFTECQGACDSYTIYNKQSEQHDSRCQCCQALQYDTVTVRLLCEDGFTTDKVVSVPSHCGCEACAESAAPFRPTKG